MIIIIIIITLIIFLFLAVKQWFKNYFLFMGLMSYIVKNKMREPEKEEMSECVNFAVRRTMDDLFK